MKADQVKLVTFQLGLDLFAADVASVEVAVVPMANVMPPPPLVRGLSAEFVRGVAKVREQLVVINDVDRVVSVTDRIVFDHAASTLVATGRG